MTQKCFPRSRISPLLALAASLLLLDGCAGEPQEAQDEPPAFVGPDAEQLAAAGSEFDGTATVHILREKTPTGVMFTARVLIDGVQQTTLVSGSYAILRIAPGVHRLDVTWPPKAAHMNNGVQFVAVAAKTYYFEYRAQAHFAIPVTQTTFTSTMVQLSKDSAEGLEQNDRFRPALDGKHAGK